MTYYVEKNDVCVCVAFVSVYLEGGVEILTRGKRRWPGRAAEPRRSPPLLLLMGRIQQWIVTCFFMKVPADKNTVW